MYGTQGLNFIISKDKYDIYTFLGLINSKLIDYLFTTKFLNLAIKADYLKKLKFPKSIAEYSLAQKAQDITLFTKNLNTCVSKFIDLFQSKFTLDKVSNKLKKWYELDFGDFLKELKKKKILLSLNEEAEWLEGKAEVAMGI